jgi:DNA-binding FadR family transcriptional regulator
MELAKSAVDRTLENLVELVISLGAGAKIPAQDVLAKQLLVSRTVLREALVVLEHLNVLNVRPKTGTTINKPDDWKTRNHDIIAWRARVEGKK